MEMEYAELSTLRFCLVDSLWVSKSTAARRSTMLWRSLKLSRSIIEYLINTPEAEVRQTTFVTLDRVWTAFEILAKSAWGLIRSSTRRRCEASSPRATFSGSSPR